MQEMGSPFYEYAILRSAGEAGHPYTPLMNPGLHESCFGEILPSGIRGAVQPSRRILDVDDDNYIDVGRPAYYLNASGF